MGFIKPNKPFVKVYTSPSDNRFNPSAVEWVKPVGRFWKLIVESTNRFELDRIIQEANSVLMQQPEGGPRKSCETWLKAAYQTHLWRIHHGTKRFS